MNNLYSRKVAIDIETTGMNRVGKIYRGHRIIEIGAVEIVNRQLTGNNFHQYINPEQKISFEAFQVHKISDDFLTEKPKFYDIMYEFIKYIQNSEIIVHNADFDISFLDYEIYRINKSFKKISEFCKITDTLKIARNLFPGKKNNLDALCKRYNLLTENRLVHSAILDAKILSKLYLIMTSVQKKIIFNEEYNNVLLKRSDLHDTPLKILKANVHELDQHEEYLKNMEKNGTCLWKN